MTDEPTNAEPRAVDPLAAWLDRPLTELTVDELMAARDDLMGAASDDEIAALARAAVFYVEQNDRESGTMWHAAVATTLAFVLGNFSAAFMQALGQRAADGAARLPKRVGDVVRTRVRRKGKPDEYHIGVDDGSAAVIAITEDTPDEARLALLDLDVMADELRGKTLRWDSSASAWRPADD